MNIRRVKIEDVNEIFRLGSLVSEFKVSDDVVNFWPKNLSKKTKFPILL